MANVAITFPIYEVQSLLHQASYLKGETPEDLRRVLNSPKTPSYYHLEQVNERIQNTPAIGGENDLLQKIWKTFYLAVRNPSLPLPIFETALMGLETLFPPEKDRGAFSDVDLQVYPETHRGYSLPPNGILQKDFEQFSEAYKKFYSHILFTNCSETLQDHILRDLSIIASRPRGRELIFELTKRMPDNYKFEIRKYDSCGFSPKGYREDLQYDLITYSPKIISLVQKLPNGDRRTLANPSFMGLAHELLHLLHRLEGTDIHIDEGRKDPTLHRLIRSREEKRTIYGDCGTETIQRCHSETDLCDNLLRKEHGLPEREWHTAVTSEYNTTSENFAAALRYNLADIFDMVPRLPPTTILEVVEKQIATAPTPTSPFPLQGVRRLLSHPSAAQWINATRLTPVDEQPEMDSEMTDSTDSIDSTDSTESIDSMDCDSSPEADKHELVRNIGPWSCCNGCEEVLDLRDA